MKRYIVLTAVLALVAIPVGKAPAQKPEAEKAQSSSNSDRAAKRKAAAQFYSLQAALFAALAQADALDRITGEPGEPDFVLCRTFISTSSRDIQGANTSSVSLGKAMHSLEKSDSMKMMREQLQAALESMDEAQAAADGHGTVSPKAKSAVASLMRALEATVLLADEIGIEAMSAPGAQAIEDAKRGGLSPGASPRKTSSSKQ